MKLERVLPPLLQKKEKDISTNGKLTMFLNPSRNWECKPIQQLATWERWVPMWTNGAQTLDVRQLELHKLPGTVQNENAGSFVCKVLRISGQQLQRIKLNLGFSKQKALVTAEVTRSQNQASCRCHSSQYKDGAKRSEWTATGCVWQSWRADSSWAHRRRGLQVLEGFLLPGPHRIRMRKMEENSEKRFFSWCRGQEEKHRHRGNWT